MIKTAKNLRELATLLRDRQKAFTRYLDIEVIEELVAPVATLCHQISCFAPSVAKSRRKQRIVIAGCDVRELYCGGEMFKLLEFMLHCPGRIEIVLLTSNESGHEQWQGTQDFINPDFVSENIKVKVFQSELGDYLRHLTPKEMDLVQLVAINSPGFDTHFESWFQDDDGILLACNSGIKVVGSSYGSDEVFGDKFICQTFGFDIGKWTTGIYQLEQNKQTTNPNIASDVFNWGGTVWELIKGTGKPDPERFNFLTKRMAALDGSFKYLNRSLLLDNGYDIFNHLCLDIKGVLHVRVYGQILLDTALFSLRNEESLELVSEPLEIDTTFFNLDELNKPFNVTMLIATVYRDHIEPYLDKPNRDETLDVIQIISGASPKEIDSIPSDLWLDWIGLAGETLLHVAAKHGNIAAIIKGLEIGLSPVSTDDNDETLLDYAFDGGQLEVVAYLLRIDECRELINRKSKLTGITFSHKAAVASNKTIVELLRSHGADFTIESHLGITAEDLLIESELEIRA